MRKKLRILLVVAFIACVAYAAIRIQQWKTEDDIREAVFRYQFAHNGSAQQARAAAYYIAIGPPDRVREPSAPLLGRFKGHTPPVRAINSCYAKGGVQGKLTGRDGVVFYVSDIKRDGRNRATVYGGYYEGNLSASGNVYTLAWRHRRWVVVRAELDWVS